MCIPTLTSCGKLKGKKKKHKFIALPTSQYKKVYDVIFYD